MKELGKALALGVEHLGEMLLACSELPSQFARLAEALAGGRSVVPLDGEVSDWPARLRATRAVSLVRQARPGDRARSLRGWLGESLSTWLAGVLDEGAALGWVLKGPVDRFADARDALLAAIGPVADAHATWYAAGAAAETIPWIRLASRLALEESVDRWVSLGFDADLPRYVSVWQRAASRWVELVVGSAVDVSLSDLGALRSLRELLEEFATRRVPRNRVKRMVAERLAISEAEVTRLLSVQAAVMERVDPREVLRRRASVFRPIAKAAAELAAAGDGKVPTVAAVARRAKVHPALVELCLDALDPR
jgi:hypothetical protein